MVKQFPEVFDKCQIVNQITIKLGKAEIEGKALRDSGHECHDFFQDSPAALWTDNKFGRTVLGLDFWIHLCSGNTAGEDIY